MSRQHRRVDPTKKFKIARISEEIAKLELPPSPAFEREAICEYIETMTAELSRMAAATGEDMLGYLLVLATQEARIKKHRAAQLQLPAA